MTECILCGKKRIKGKYPFRDGFRCSVCKDNNRTRVKKIYSYNRFEATIWFMENLVYNVDTQSFTTRLFHAFNKEKPQNKLDYQNIANKILAKMAKEFEKYCEGYNYD